MIIKIRLILPLITIITQIYGLSSSSATTDTLIQLAPEAHYGKTALGIAQLLSQKHYEKKILDDSLSSIIFNNYIENLDPNRIYFLASDIDKFETYRYFFDDMIIKGDLRPAYYMFNTYISRFDDRMNYVFDLLDNDFDYTKEEFYRPDRRELPWAENAAELNTIWRKRITNETLNLDLSGKERDKIVELLKERYNNYGKRIKQSNSEDVFQLVMNSFTEVYDPHTNYLPPKNMDDFMIQMSQSVKGIGALLSMEDEYTKVVELVAGGPAERSKQLHPNDKIIGVGQDENGEIVDVIGWRLDNVVQLIRGPIASTVRLQLVRADANPTSPTDTIKLVRDEVKLTDSVKSDTLEILHNGKERTIGVIRIKTFYADYDAMRRGDPKYNSTSRDVDSLLREFGDLDVDAIIIDVRGNGGGYLSESIDLTGLFIEKGPVVQVRESNGRKSVERDRDSRVAYSGPLAVVVDRISASASEIFAAAIQDYDRGIIIGSQTFGKGTVQRPQDLDQLFRSSDVKRGSIKYTTAKFYRVNGGSTQHVGVLPDITLPSRYTVIDIGESTHPFALLWDKISAVSYEDYDLVQPYLPDIQSRLKERLENDQIYSDLVMEIAELENAQNKKEISLNKENRKKEYKETEERGKQRDERRKEQGNGDFVLNETAHILSDLIELQGR
jgi:carboxyl-terminal processing protease